MAVKLEAKYERYDEPQPEPVICINPECDYRFSVSNGTGVVVTYPDGGPSRPLTGWLCTRCAKVLLKN